MAWYEKLWQAFVEFNKNRLIMGIFHMKEEDYQHNFENMSKSAKALSDFIGIIVRLAFVQFAWRYFFYMSKKTDGIYSFIFMYCGIFAFILSIFVLVKIVMIMFLWNVGDIVKMPNNTQKTVIFLISALSTLIIYLGMLRMVSDLARASTLLGTI